MIKVFLKKIKAAGRAAQKIVAIALLFILYALGFGITAFLAAIFEPCRRADKQGNSDSFWRDAEGYDLDPDELSRQS